MCCGGTYGRVHAAGVCGQRGVRASMHIFLVCGSCLPALQHADPHTHPCTPRHQDVYHGRGLGVVESASTGAFSTLRGGDGSWVTDRYGSWA